MNRIFSKKRLLNRRYVAIVALVISVCALGVLATLSGPRIRATELNENLLNQTYTMTFNTEIELTIEDFTITPAIASDTQVLKDRVIVIFKEPLSYSQKYTITLKATDLSGTSDALSSSFVSSDQRGFYLTRDSAKDDTINTFLATDTTGSERVYSSAEIVLYSVSRHSLAVLENIDGSPILYLVRGSNRDEIILPNNKKVDELQGSATKDSYLMRLIDEDSFRSSLWEYNVENDSLYELLDNTGDSLQVSDISYAPDGNSIIYQDENRVLQLRNFSTDQIAITFGEFDTLRRFLPNEKAVFGYRNNKPVGVKASDGSFIEPLEQAELSYQALLLQDLESYVYFAQRFNNNTSKLEQLVISLADQKESILYSTPIENSLLLNMGISPNDQFLYVEEAPRPTIYDDRQPNAKPQGIATTVYDRKTGQEIRSIVGFDIQWRYK